MHIKVLLNLGSGWPSYREDQEVDADEKVAARLIAAGLATKLSITESTPQNITEDSLQPTKSSQFLRRKSR